MEMKSETQSPAGQSPALAVDAWLAGLDLLAVVADSESYKTEQIKGDEVARFWAEAQWLHGLSDAPDDQLADFVADVADKGNWWHAAWEPWHYEWDIGEGAGSIVFIRLTHAKANQ